MGNKNDKTYTKKDPLTGQEKSGAYFSAPYNHNGGTFEFCTPPVPFNRVWTQDQDGRETWAILLEYPADHPNAQKVMTFFKQLHDVMVQLVKPTAAAFRITVHGDFVMLKELVGNAKDKETGQPIAGRAPGSFFKLYPSCRFYLPNKKMVDRTMLKQAKGEVALTFHVRNLYSSGNGTGYPQIFIKSGVITDIEMVGPEMPTDLIESLTSSDVQLSATVEDKFAQFQLSHGDAVKEKANMPGDANMTSISGAPLALPPTGTNQPANLQAFLGGTPGKMASMPPMSSTPDLASSAPVMTSAPVGTQLVFNQSGQSGQSGQPGATAMPSGLPQIS